MNLLHVLCLFMIDTVKQTETPADSLFVQSDGCAVGQHASTGANLFLAHVTTQRQQSAAKQHIISPVDASAHIPSSSAGEAMLHSLAAKCVVCVLCLQ